MEPQYIRPVDFKAMQESIGPKAAEAWRVKHNLIVGMPPEEKQMDETVDVTETPDETEVEETVYPATGGGLGAVNAYSAYQAAQKRVDAQIKANIDLLTKAQDRLRERRIGPSNAEKWFSIAAALGKPTRTGSFGESLGNLGEVLGQQQAMKRKAQEERDALLEQYGLKIGNEQLRMLQSGASQAGQVYRSELAAGKKDKGALPKATVGPDFIPRTRFGTEIKTPPIAAIYTLRDYLSNPNNSDEDKEIARRNFDGKFGFGTAKLFSGERE